MVMFSIIVPVYNEQENLTKLDFEIRATMSELGTYEIIYVNDGSKDNSLQILKQIKNCTIIDLQRNYGQSVALDAGFKQATGEYIISIDADLQNDPSDLPRMFHIMQKNKLDVIVGWRKNRKDQLYVRILTKISQHFRRKIINEGIHDSGCTLRIYTNRAAKSLDLWGQMHRYITALLRWKGFKIGETIVNHRNRYRGVTKYGPLKAVHGFIDLIFMWFIDKYSRRPLHLFGALSFILLFFGSTMELIVLLQKIIEGVKISTNTFFITGFFLMLMAIQFFVSGVMIDIQLRSYYNTSPIEKRYKIKEIIQTKIL